LRVIADGENNCALGMGLFPMRPEEVSFVDRLVRGTVRTAYDFVQLSLFGLLLPLVRLGRFWRAFTLIQKRFSTLTHLALWILFAVALASGNDATLASGFVGLSAAPNVWVVYTIAEALLITMIVDTLIWLCLVAIKNKSRRRRYQSLSRLSVANLYFGASMVMLLVGRLTIFGRLEVLMWAGPAWLSNSPILLPNLAGPLFACSLAFVVTKTASIRDWKLKFLSWSLVVVAAPVFLLNLSFWIYLMPSQIREWLSPAAVPHVTIQQQSTGCVLSSGKIHVSTYLSLHGTSSLPFEATDFTVYYLVPNNDLFGGWDHYYVGRVLENQGYIILSNERYVRVSVIASFDPIDSTQRPAAGSFECSLGVVKDLDVFLKRQSDVIVEPLPK
jgi:hypothetical protein